MTITPAGKPKHADLPALGPTDIAEPARTAGAGSFGMRITGIGGTGIVTISQVLATAAVIDGRHARSLDQTGLAQKGGAVVSDIKITEDAVEQGAKIAEGQCDLYLACDPLVATDPKYLSVASADRTVAVMTTTEIPTGQMVVDTTVGFPAPDVVRHAVHDAMSRLVARTPARWPRSSSTTSSTPTCSWWVPPTRPGCCRWRLRPSKRPSP